MDKQEAERLARQIELIGVRYVVIGTFHYRDGMYGLLVTDTSDGYDFWIGSAERWAEWQRSATPPRRCQVPVTRK